MRVFRVFKKMDEQEYFYKYCVADSKDEVEKRYPCDCKYSIHELQIEDCTKKVKNGKRKSV